MTSISPLRLGVILLAICGWPQAAFAQITHSDIFFRYVDLQIKVEPQDGRLVIPQVFPESGFFAQSNANPGFFSETDLGGGTGANDIVAYNVLDGLIFWSDGEFQEAASETEIRIVNNPAFVDDTVISATTREQRATFDPLTNSIGQSSANGEFHSHIDFQLKPNPADGDDPPAWGAYGIKLSLSTDNVAIAESDPFLIVYQFGIEDEMFESALDDFASLLTSTETLLGDFDGDGTLTSNDIDLLSVETKRVTPNELFDVTSDGEVNEADRSFWIETVAGSLLGDADLNRVVDFADFLLLSAAFGQEGGWAAGDFDGNQQVEFSDFLLLSSNFGASLGESQTVPEPNSQLLALVAMMIGLSVRHGKQDRRKSLAPKKRKEPMAADAKKLGQMRANSTLRSGRRHCSHGLASAARIVHRRVLNQPIKAGVFCSICNNCHRNQARVYIARRILSVAPIRN